MSKKNKVWTFVLTFFLMILDIILHFATCETDFSCHINYISSILVAFTLGLWMTETPRWKGLENGKTE